MHTRGISLSYCEQSHIVNRKTTFYFSCSRSRCFLCCATLQTLLIKKNIPGITTIKLLDTIYNGNNPLVIGPS